MKIDIRLYISGQLIEFSTDPKILLNYKETELHNPTIVRNSFTKQITVEGTQKNNDIFGHIWNLERIQADNFNPIRKTDFELYVNDELFQRGYCKLDKITRTNVSTEYQITLYGNLGQFFYNLSYEEDSANTKKTLASLHYTDDGGISEPDMDFIINKDNVYQAWAQIAGYGTTSNPRWDVINFIPAYNGIPGDFDAAKVLINNNGNPIGFLRSKTVDGTEYKPVLSGQLSYSGYTMGEMPHELTEWQTRDLRSYNQRPAISMYRIIRACCQPENNGGFQVKLDPHFFHYNNPYYQSAWLTLPLLKDLEGVGGGETYNITGATVSTSSTIYKPINFNSPTQASINNVNLNLSVRFRPESTTSATNLYGYRHFTSKNVTTLDNWEYIKDFKSNCGVVLQMFAYGRNGEVVGQSKAYFLGTSKNFPGYNDPMWEYFWNSEEVGAEPEYVYMEGYWKKIGGNYVFVNNNGQATDINFSFTAPSNFDSLVLKVKQPRGEYEKYFGVLWSGGESKHKAGDSTVVSLYTSKEFNGTGRYTITQAMTQDRVRGEWYFVVTSMEGIATDYEGLFSGTKITKNRLLTTEYSPADYLLSYCKLFGLYFYYDSTEESDDPLLYPSGVVHIMDRDTFYTDEVVDLSKMIDWGKKVEIIPAMAAAKWYKFDVEHTESELETGYKEQFGKEYGSQLVNTNYNFDNNTVNLYDGNAFKSGIMALEKDKYYKKDGTGLPVYQYNGLTYTLFNRTNTGEEFDTTEIDFPIQTTMHMTSINQEYEFYDMFPKLQAHGEDNAAADGSNVLMFFKGAIGGGTDYWLTDDITEMITLNDASPCWIFTKSEYDGAGTQIAIKVTSFPYFTRDLIPFTTYGNITNSWNFGHPQVIYSPDTYTTDGDSIYDKCWRDYIRDIYDVNTRKLSCYVRAEMDDKPWPYWLRRFYWFENSIWMLNEIKDLNPASFDTVKMEFIKVQDMDNYKLEKIDYQGGADITLDVNEIGCASGTVHGTVYLQSGGYWAASDYIQGIDGYGNSMLLESETHMTPTTGRGETTTFSVRVPENTGDTQITWTITLIDGMDRRMSASFTQQTCNTGSTLQIRPTSRLVSQPSGSTTFSVTSVRVSGMSVNSSQSWATASLSNNMVVVNYTTNETSTRRGATITVTGTGVEGPISATATLLQNGLGGIQVDMNNITIDYNSTSGNTVRVITSGNWSSSINDN